MKHGRIAIVGAGAVGAYYGARLQQAGHDVSFYTRSARDEFRANGLRISSIAGDFNLPSLKAFDDTVAMGPADLIIVALKSTAIDAYVPLVKPLIGPDSVILSLQNGLGNEEVFGEAFGAERVLGAIAFTCINRTSPTQISHIAHGLLRIGEFGSRKLERSESIAAMFRDAKVPAEAIADLRHHRWEKLVWNIPFNGWGTALNLHTAALLGTSAGQTLVRETMAEVIRAANAVGVQLKQSQIDFEIGRTAIMGEYHTSMQLDRQHGRALEIDAIIGKPLEYARSAGEADLPRMTTLLACLQLLVNPEGRSA
jgi:2-dehydropantoate 2-reductase